jgi:hypothetical protein
MPSSNELRFPHALEFYAGISMSTEHPTFPPTSAKIRPQPRK